MTAIAIFGGTGYSGGNIAAEAVRRGFSVTAIARNAPANPLEGVTYQQGTIDDAALVADLAKSHDVVVVAIHAVDAAQNPVLPAAIPAVAAAVVAGGARLGVVGGAGSSLTAEGGPRVVDTPGFPDAYKPEALTHAGILDWLREQPEPLDWFYVSPAAEYGAHQPGTATGAYRTGGDVLVAAADGSSKISGADFALAFVDEIERPAHRRARFTTGY